MHALFGKHTGGYIAVCRGTDQVSQAKIRLFGCCIEQMPNAKNLLLMPVTRDKRLIGIKQVADMFLPHDVLNAACFPQQPDQCPDQRREELSFESSSPLFERHGFIKEVMVGRTVVARCL